MTHEAADGGGDLPLVFADVQEDQTIPGVRQPRIPEVPVTGEKRRALEPMKDGENVFVGGAGLGDVRPDLADSDAPLTQPPDFAFRDVFVDEEHAA